MIVGSTRFLARWLLTVVGASLLLFLLPISARAGAVRQLTWDAPITPVAAEYLVGGLADAEAAGDEAVLILLDTPGGLDTAMRDIVKAQLGATMPVIVYVGPAGSRAASAGAFIALAAHVAAMAPGTNIGSASPVQMGGAGMDSTMAHKVTNDAAAYIASLAQRRGRDPEIARRFVTEASNLTAEEAQAAGMIDFVAADVTAVLDSLRGRPVTVAGDTVRLRAVVAEIVVQDPSARQKLLKILADPNLAYILMMLGIYGLFFELSNPGAFAPGVLGGICLLLALFAFQAMPVDYTGAALILLGVVLLILEVKVTSFGVLSLGGVTALVLGSLMLFDSPDPWARVSLRVLVPTVTVFAGFFILCVWLAVRGQRRPVISGLEAMVGERGRVLRALDPDGVPGKIIVHGEVWDATASSFVAVDTQVRVLAVAGRRLHVEPAPADPSTPTGS